MMSENFYLCTLNIQNPAGLTTIFVTAAIASTNPEAINIASKQTLAILPAGWSLASGTAGALKTELLEEVAERVLGWHRP